MALQLMKISISGDISTDVKPTSNKFFFITTKRTNGEGTLTIKTDDFSDDNGDDNTELPELADDNSYFTVTINGVEQMQDLLTYTAGDENSGSLEITVPTNESIAKNQPIVLSVVNFSPESTGDFNS